MVVLFYSAHNGSAFNIVKKIFQLSMIISNISSWLHLFADIDTNMIAFVFNKLF